MSSDRTMYLRENAGVVTKTENTAFHHPSVDALLMTSYDIGVLGNLRWPVFVSVDTAGGGASATAICSGVYLRNHTLVVSYRLV